MKEPDPGLRSRRVALCALIAGFLGTLGGLSVALVPFENYWVRLQIKAVPPPTEGFRCVAHGARSPGGFVLLTAAALACGIAVVRGRWDPWLRRLMVVAVVLNLVVVLWFIAAIYLPTIRLHSPNVPLLD